jgi:hypothetical protein
MTTQRFPMDSAGRPISVGDTVTWRGKFYTIRAFGERFGPHDLYAIEFVEPLHIQGEIPDEFGVDLVDETNRSEFA